MRLLLSLVICCLFFSCTHKTDTPDVSAIKVDLTVKRFEQDFFALDTNDLMPHLGGLLTKYPSFGNFYLTKILGVLPEWPADTAAFYIKEFISYDRSVYDTSEKIFTDFSPYEKQVKHGLQFVKYYFPGYKIPTEIITFIGPADGTGDALGPRGELLIGLHAHLGKDFPLYKTDEVEDTYPEYVSAKFTPDYIAVNCMKNIVDDLFPDNAEDKRLIIQMVEKGKHLYLLSKFLPETEEYMLIGYTKAQMQDCYAREGQIWNFFIQNNYLQLADNNTVKNYVSDGPKTQELGEGAPGNIGSFAGWQIVKKFMEKNPGIKVDSLMRVDDEKLFEESKYKP